MKHKLFKAVLTVLLPALLWGAGLQAQDISRQRSGNMELIWFGSRFNYLLPHVSYSYHNAMAFHRQFWGYTDTTTYVLINDFEDMGHGGAIAMPFSQVILGIEPYGFAFSIIPSNERFQWLFNHELTHIVMSDKGSRQDERFRRMLGGKVRRNEEYPMSAIWSYLTTPRWYAPRWFHEGIACFLETWMSGGLGRAMGTYDEMYFRSIVDAKKPIYSLVGLETEGTTIDFQVGANAYLYGTRFVSYLAYQYGIEPLKAFYNRTDSAKSFFAAQFKQVYGRPLSTLWQEWTEWEVGFQRENLERLAKHQVTEFNPIVEQPMGSVSTMAYDAGRGKIYAAINYPGILSQVAEIDQRSGKIRKLATLDSPELYKTTSLAYNPDDQKIYITELNTKYRNLVEIDILTGKKKVLNPMTRTGDLVYNRQDRSIWGIQHNNGNSILVRIPAPYDKVLPVYTAPFGRVLFDLSISHSGDKLVASLSGVKGEQSVILFEMSDLSNGLTRYRTLLELDDNTLTQFKFALDDRSVIGTSYYTGVSNVWQLQLDDGRFDLLSNTQTGLFMPLQISADSLLVLRFERDGMVPGTMPVKVLHDAESLVYLGNEIYQRHPEVGEWSLPPASMLKDSIILETPVAYHPLKEMKLANAYPDIAGFKNTLAVGYRFNWRDPVGVSNINLFLATSPWSDYENRQKVHLQFDWEYWNWRFVANFNKTHFYDLFGPTQRSRAGYSVGLEYRRDWSLKKPLLTYYEWGVYSYGGLEVLPQYQNVASPIRSFQAATASYGRNKLRKTLGGVVDEQGYSWDISGTAYWAGGQLFPSFVSNQDFGVLIPGIRNTSFWIRNSVGQSFGPRDSGLSKFYFGGFRNNYVDWQPSEQYRKALAFPGAEIDAIAARNYVKTMGELNLKPLRLRDVGTSWLYPTYVKPAVFVSHLMTDFDLTAERKHHFNVGAQVDLQLVLFSYLKTTWSVGYAHMPQPDAPGRNQWMLSLKLLGD